jgi:4'-phosphopantetheinyl transferase
MAMSPPARFAAQPIPPAAPTLPLSVDEVHCWSASLDGVAPEAFARLEATLTAGERERSTRFRFERDRRRFIAARGTLRDILGRYLGIEPGGIEFVYNPFGKPGLRPGPERRLEFNLSHAGGRALIAVATDSRVGVDLESVHPHRDHAEIARHSFSAREVEQLHAVPRHRYAEAFLGCWTKKEAWLKARGHGLTMPMSRLPVPLTTDAARDPIEIFGLSNERWSFYALRPAPGYIGALVLEGAGRRLRQERWETLLG